MQENIARDYASDVMRNLGLGISVRRKSSKFCGSMMNLKRQMTRRLLKEDLSKDAELADCLKLAIVSLSSLVDLCSSQTMKIHGKIGNQEVKVSSLIQVLLIVLFHRLWSMICSSQFPLLASLA